MLRIPVDVSDSSVLENLIGGHANGINFTTGITIALKLYRFDPYEEFPSEGILEGGDETKFRLPTKVASSSLNLLIRLLILKLPDNRLKKFS